MNPQCRRNGYSISIQALVPLLYRPGCRFAAGIRGPPGGDLRGPRSRSIGRG
jgi:hypothetical protein